jgi:hypothetical protein
MEKIKGICVESNLRKISDVSAVSMYRFDRYGRSCTMALFYSEDEIKVDWVRKRVRLTDQTVQLEDNLILLIFEETKIAGGIKASEKLLVIISEEIDADIFCGVVECKKKNEGTLVINKLINLINYAIANGHRNEVIDSSYLDGVY